MPPPPTLPPNVAIFSPKQPAAVQSLLSAKLFTRLVVSTSTSPEQLKQALAKVDEGFSLSHRNAVLIFDGGQGDAEALEDRHHDHFRVVCLALKDADIGLSFAKCVFDATEALQAGFQLDGFSKAAALVIDLMEEDEEDSEDEEDEDGDEDAEAHVGDESK